MKTKKRKIWCIIAGVILLLLAALAVMVGISVQKYMDTHTWATVTVSGERHGDTDEAFDETHEYLKGDCITCGSVSLEITKITHDGTVTCKVAEGTLKDDAGVEVAGCTVTRDTPGYFIMEHGTMMLRVVSNRYQ